MAVLDERVRMPRRPMGADPCFGGGFSENRGVCLLMNGTGAVSNMP